VVALTATLKQRDAVEPDYIDEFLADPILLDESDSWAETDQVAAETENETIDDGSVEAMIDAKHSL
jgi:hypothetical protein